MDNYYVVALKWKDKRDVFLLTTVHQPKRKVEVVTSCLSIVQAHILHNQVLVLQGKARIGLHKFIISLGGALYEDYISKRAAITGTPHTVNQPVPQPINVVRLTEKHFPTLLPPTSKAKPRRACKVCFEKSRADPNRDKSSRKRAKTRWWCPVCLVPLCVETACFRDFHTKENYLVNNFWTFDIWIHVNSYFFSFIIAVLLL